MSTANPETTRAARAMLGPMTTRMPTAFVPHGGGPWPLLPLPGADPDEAAPLRAYMASISDVPRPTALLVVSAHWEEPEFTVNTGAAPGLLYDYGGFPPEAYRLQWPAAGAPELAEQVRDLLSGAGLDSRADATRGFDHGVFIPLLPAWPNADMPVVQVSLKRGLDPGAHLALGRALAPLRDAGVHILGSGNSFHNLGAFASPDPRVVAAAEAFDAWLAEAVASANRADLLTAWTEAPHARFCHPREEHLLPLMVVAGAATEPGRVQWSGQMFGKRVSAHHFG
jgi:aromatic ring-opening dioxygenase catalytic subunit (LigB family)